MYDFKIQKKKDNPLVYSSIHIKKEISEQGTSVTVNVSNKIRYIKQQRQESET